MSDPEHRSKDSLGLSRTLTRIIGGPGLYNAVQIACGVRHTHARLRPLLADTDDKLVLDLGAGTGLALPILPRRARYVWVDRDPLKLHGCPLEIRRRAVIGDATQLPFRDRRVDVALCFALSHHLADAQLEAMLGELQRVVRDRVIFVDAVDVPGRLLSRLLWRIDRGSYPRRRDVLLHALARRFTIERLDEYAVYHRYLLCTARPR